MHYLIKSGSNSPSIMECWVVKIRALEWKKCHYEDILRRELDGLGDEFGTLKFLSIRRTLPIHSIPYSVAQPLERGSNNYYSIERCSAAVGKRN